VTTLPGVTVANPPIQGTASWTTQAGADAESDPAYRGRCKAKWGTLGSGSTEPAYIYNAATPNPTDHLSGAA